MRVTTLPTEVLLGIVEPALRLMPPSLTSAKAKVMLLAIGLQESGLKERAQIVDGGKKGPARGLWQFEAGGGVKGVMQHHASKELAQSICEARGVPFDRAAIWAALERDDLLACCIARLLLLTDPKPLPNLGDEQGAWAYYQRNWRPGKPHPDRWSANYAKALEAVMKNSQESV